MVEERQGSRGSPVSTPAISRADFQQLADVRLKEAKALLDLGMWDGAYYLAGYAVEVALKACIIKIVMATSASFFRTRSLLRSAGPTTSKR
jgi:HEPN domain-containing protein